MYLGNQKNALICPTDSTFVGVEPIGPLNGQCYGLNMSTVSGGYSFDNSDADTYLASPLKESEILLPDQTIYSGDTRLPSAAGTASLRTGYYMLASYKSHASGQLVPVHSRSVNILWCDGRVSSIASRSVLTAMGGYTYPTAYEDVGVCSTANVAVNGNTYWSSKSKVRKPIGSFEYEKMIVPLAASTACILLTASGTEMPDSGLFEMKSGDYTVTLLPKRACSLSGFAYDGIQLFTSDTASAGSVVQPLRTPEKVLSVELEADGAKISRAVSPVSGKNWSSQKQAFSTVCA